jgi:parvulin-like peptidyl-prolyl isomerase
MLLVMKRTVMAVAAGALFLAACGAGNAVEATVNQQEITTEDVEGVVFEVTDADRTPEQFATYLSVLIQWDAIEQRVDTEIGFEPTEDAVDTQVRTIVLSAGFDNLGSFLTQQNLSEPFLRRLATHLLIEQHLHDSMVVPIEEPTTEEAEQALADSPDEWIAEVCAFHILVATTEEADAVLVRLDAGEEFADLAGELSLDNGNAATGGSLGCADPGGYVDEFAEATRTAPIGEVVGPVETQFGAHLIIVESKTPATVDEVLDGLAVRRQILADQAAFTLVSDWLNEAVTAAAVTIEERRGTWVTDPEPQVIPPAILE